MKKRKESIILKKEGKYLQHEELTERIICNYCLLQSYLRTNRQRQIVLLRID